MKSEKVLKEEEKKESPKNFIIKKKNININNKSLIVHKMNRENNTLGKIRGSIIE